MVSLCESQVSAVSCVYYHLRIPTVLQQHLHHHDHDDGQSSAIRRRLVSDMGGHLLSTMGGNSLQYTTYELFYRSIVGPLRSMKK